MSIDTMINGFRKGTHLEIHEGSLCYTRNKRICGRSKEAIESIKKEQKAVQYIIEAYSKNSKLFEDPQIGSLYTALISRQKEINSMRSGIRGLFKSQAQKDELFILSCELNKLKGLFPQDILPRAFTQRLSSSAADPALLKTLKKEFPTFFKRDVTSLDIFKEVPFVISQRDADLYVKFPPIKETSSVIQEIYIGRNIRELPTAIRRYQAHCMIGNLPISHYSTVYNTSPSIAVQGRITEADCSYAIGKINYTLYEDRNEILFTFYDPIDGVKKNRLDFKDKGREEVTQIAKNYAAQSNQAHETILSIKQKIENVTKNFNLELEVSLKNKKYVIKDQAKNVLIEIPFSREEGKIIEQVENFLHNRLCAQINKSSPQMPIFYHYAHVSKFIEQAQPFEGLGVKINAQEQNIKVFFYDTREKAIRCESFEMNESAVGKIAVFAQQQKQIQQQQSRVNSFIRTAYYIPKSILLDKLFQQLLEHDMDRPTLLKFIAKFHPENSKENKEFLAEFAITTQEDLKPVFEMLKAFFQNDPDMSAKKLLEAAFAA